MLVLKTVIFVPALLPIAGIKVIDSKNFAEFKKEYLRDDGIEAVTFLAPDFTKFEVGVENMKNVKIFGDLQACLPQLKNSPFKE